MKKSAFLLLVLAELNTIKANATPEEIAKLDWETFQPNKQYHCVYGQMTGWYANDRAREISPKIFILDTLGVGIQHVKFSDLNFKVVNYFAEKKFTALELYLYTTNRVDGTKLPKQEKILQYLKGEISEITL